MSQRAYIVIVEGVTKVDDEPVAEAILNAVADHGLEVIRVNPFGGEDTDTAGSGGGPKPTTNLNQIDPTFTGF